MSTITLWKDREKKIVDPLLFSQRAEEVAKQLGSGGRNVNKGSQLRRFFDEIVRLNDTARHSETDMDFVLPYLHMMIAKATYARGRRLVTDEFVQLIKDGVNQVQTKDDLKVFTNFFESFMAFYKVHGPN